MRYTRHPRALLRAADSHFLPPLVLLTALFPKSRRLLHTVQVLFPAPLYLRKPPWRRLRRACPPSQVALLRVLAGIVPGNILAGCTLIYDRDSFRAARVCVCVCVHDIILMYV